MDIAVIGAGNVGRSLTTAFRRAGHVVTIASSDPADSGAVAIATGARAAVSNLDAVRAADIVVLAIPFGSAAESLAREIAPAIAGKIVVDVTNPLNPTYDGLLTAGGPSAAEQFAAWLPGARVVKAFNTLFASVQADPIVDGVQLDAFVAGDDDVARTTILDLARSIGFRAMSVGPLARARELEAVAFLGIALQGTLGNTWHTAWKIVGVPAGVLEQAA
jgi:predicted dinucleotide-binding enzyme